MPILIDEKEAIRKSYRLERSRLQPEERAAADEQILSRLISHTVYTEAMGILLFFPVRGEPDITPLFNRAIGDGKQVFFPVSDTETLHLTFRRITSLAELAPGSYRIPEPKESAPALSLDHTANILCLVPGLGFDRRGFRLGCGKGYYDRFLSDFHGTSAGIVYDRFLTDTLPIGPFDRKVNMIITEKGVSIP